ncbi:MAG: PilN domain-containing protein, partial [Candidatus Omnitrophica bacterium]|nr:PilN domain-containing protein [Candidatus Omnitrophota bacterium]
SDDMKILSMMRPVLERLVTQIKRSFEYCEHQFGCAPVKKIILAGGGAKLKGLKEYLSKEIEIEILDPLPEIAEAVGLGLMRNTDLNMLPEKFKEEKGRELKKVSLRMISIVLGLIFLFSYGILLARAVNLKKELEIYNQHLETVVDIRAIKDKMVILGSAVNTISSSTIETGKTMKELSNLMVPSAVLDSLVIKDTEPHIELSGVVLKEEELSEFMSNLEASPMFEKVKLVFSEKNEDRSKGALDFEIRCNLE